MSIDGFFGFHFGVPAFATQFNTEGHYRIEQGNSTILFFGRSRHRRLFTENQPALQSREYYDK